VIAFTIRRNGFQIFQELDDAGDCLGTQTVLYGAGVFFGCYFIKPKKDVQEAEHEFVPIEDFLGEFKSARRQFYVAIAFVPDQLIICQRPDGRGNRRRFHVQMLGQVLDPDDALLQTYDQYGFEIVFVTLTETGHCLHHLRRSVLHRMLYPVKILTQAEELVKCLKILSVHLNQRGAAEGPTFPFNSVRAWLTSNRL
jgi:hypothetical protein